jgi:signal transduction histidine kinase
VGIELSSPDATPGPETLSAEAQTRLLAALPGGVLVAADDGTAVYANPAARELLGLSADDPLAQAACELATYVDDGGAVPFAFLASGEPRSDVARVLLAVDGDLVPVRVTQIVLPGLGGAEVLVAELGCRELDELRADLGGTLNHDIRAGVSAVVLGLDAAVSLDENLSELTRKFLDRSQAACSKVIRLISDAHDVVRLNAGLASLRKEPVELAELVETGIEDVRRDAEDADIAMRVELRCPDIAPIADASRMSRILGNLAKLAVDGSHRGGDVAISFGQRDDDLRLSVRFLPHGGVPEHARDAFSRFRSPEVRACLKPLGPPCAFSYCHCAAKAHGGRAWCEVDGEHLEYCVEIPISTDAAD